MIRAVTGLETAPLEEGAVVFEPTSGKFLLFNSSAACVWSQLASATTAESLASALVGRFSGLSEATALQDAQNLVEQMLTLGIIETLPEPAMQDAP